MLGDRCDVLKISEPIKSHWAKEKNLNLNELLSDSEYKEQHRLDMIRWSEEMRTKDYGYFCKTACQNANDAAIWIVSDIRRRTDIKWFKETYKHIVRTIRIHADEETRKSRGFVFKDGIDNAASECDLDDYSGWDVTINNGDGRNSLEEQLGVFLECYHNYDYRSIELFSLSEVEFSGNGIFTIFLFINEHSITLQKVEKNSTYKNVYVQ